MIALTATLVHNRASALPYSPRIAAMRSMLLRELITKNASPPRHSRGHSARFFVLPCSAGAICGSLQPQRISRKQKARVVPGRSCDPRILGAFQCGLLNGPEAQGYAE